MAITKLVTKEELLDFIGPWNLLWYVIVRPHEEIDYEGSKYDFVHLCVELGCYYRLLEDAKVLRLIINIENLSKMEVIELINNLNTKGVEKWQEDFQYMKQDRLNSIYQNWSNK